VTTSSPLSGTAFDGAVVLSDADVAELIPHGEAVEALEQAFREEALGSAENMERTRIIWDHGRMQSLGGHVSGRECAAVKSWVVTSEGAQPTLLLFSTKNGRLLALMEAAELGRIRTGAASGVAIRHLARADVRTLLLVGTGRQAFAQVAAALHVREFTRVLVAARDRKRTEEFAAILTDRFGISARAVDSVESAAAEADVITTITTAREPVLMADWVRPGTLVNAVGAIVPGALEVDPALFARADRIVVDSVSQAAKESAELRAAVEDHGVAPDSAVPLHQVIGTTPRARDITVFKSLGVGLEDAAVAELAWRRSTSLAATAS